MKRYLLDTNICISFMKGRYGIKEKIREVRLANCGISEITVAELLYGAYHSNNQTRYVEETKRFISCFTVLPISGALELFAENKSQLTRAGLPIDNFDLLIGCTAVANKMIMVSDNIRHLSRIKQISIENWTQR